MAINNILPFMILIPILGCFCISRIDERSHAFNIYLVSLWTASFVVLLSIGLLFFLNEQIHIETSFFNFSFVINDVSIYMLAITSILTCISILISRYEIKANIKTFNILLLLLESLLFILFLTGNILIFCVLFELILIVTFLLIGIFTSEPICASKFFFVLSVGALFILFGVIYIIDITGVTEVNILSKYCFTLHQEHIIFSVFFIGFACKTALFPFQIWLPDTLTSTPTSLSIILSGILLKIGTFGMITVLIPIAKRSCFDFNQYIFTISIITIIYAILSAILQKDLKRIIAYISIMHMAIITIGIFSYSIEGISGAFFNMIAHSIVIPSLFIIIHIIENKFKSRSISLSGIAIASPLLSIIAVIPILSVISTPLLPIFTGEFLILYSCFKYHFFILFALCILITCSVFYGLKIYQKIFFGECNLKKTKLTSYELLYTIPVISLIIIIGIFPNKIIQSIENTMTKILAKSFYHDL